MFTGSSWANTNVPMVRCFSDYANNRIVSETDIISLPSLVRSDTVNHTDYAGFFAFADEGFCIGEKNGRFRLLKYSGSAWETADEGSEAQEFETLPVVTGQAFSGRYGVVTEKHMISVYTQWIPSVVDSSVFSGSIWDVITQIASGLQSVAYISPDGVLMIRRRDSYIDTVTEILAVRSEKTTRRWANYGAVKFGDVQIGDGQPLTINSPLTNTDVNTALAQAWYDLLTGAEDQIERDYQAAWELEILDKIGDYTVIELKLELNSEKVTAILVKF